jgi:hypothetical protein
MANASVLTNKGNGFKTRFCFRRVSQGVSKVAEPAREGTQGADPEILTSFHLLCRLKARQP